MKSIRNLAAHIREVSQHFGSKRLSPAAASKLNCRFEKMALATILCSLQLVRFQILEEDRVALKMTIVSQKRPGDTIRLAGAPVGIPSRSFGRTSNPTAPSAASPL
jgi:translation initiation factor IF-1